MDEYEPNEGWPGYWFDSMDDTDGFPYETVQATLYPAGDVDFFRAYDHDTPWGVLRPVVMLSNIRSRDA